MSCRNAIFSIDDWFTCSVTGDSCKFINPDSVECARRFNEGPNAAKINDGSLRRRKS